MNYTIVFSLMLAIAFSGCSPSGNNEVNKSKTEATAPAEQLPELSIFNLPSSWTTQDGTEIELKDLRGNVLVVVMIYTSCQAACPRLVADVRNIQASVPAEKNEEVKYVFVSIDPKTDTPQRLKAFAIENEMDSEQWLFLRGSEIDTRTFAAVLAVSYKQISPIDFSHSNIISVFDKEGVLVSQKEGLGIDDTQIIQAIEEYTS